MCLYKPFLVFIFFISLSSQAQNLVPNGSFEENVGLPIMATQWDLCQGWSNVNENPTNQAATPDYYHMSSSSSYGLPVSTNGVVYPHQGDAVMGIIGLHPFTDWREYLSTQLTQALVIGKEYRVSFWITNGGEYSPYLRGCSGMGIELTENSTSQNIHEHITPNNYNFVVDSIIADTNWLQISFDFTADLAYQYITIGSFYTPAAITSAQMDTIGYINGAYYFIDDVELICTEEVCYNPAVVEMPNIFTPNEDLINDWFQPVAFDQFNNYKIVVVNRWGQEVYRGTTPNFGWDGTYLENKCIEGVYYWFLDYETLDGEELTKHGFVQLAR